MAWITPLFLLGLLGIAVPYWLHRLETQTTQRQQFSTIRFLEAAKKRVHIQRELKYRVLMALRMLLLALLALAFARPIFFSEPTLVVSADTTHHVIVIDTSFSMRYDNHIAVAREQAADIINSMGSDDIVSLYSASSAVTTIASPSNNGSNALEVLNSVEADNGRMDIGAMVSNLNGLLEDSAGAVVLHVISDFQQSAQALRFADMIPDVVNNRPVQLDIRQVSTSAGTNTAIAAVVIEDRQRVIASVDRFASDAAEEQTLTLSINGVMQQQQSLTLNAGLTQVSFDEVSFEPGDNKVDVSLTNTDDLVADNTRHAVFDNSPPAPVLLLTSDLDSLGVTYISAALETAPRGYVVDATDISELDARIMQRYPWLIIEDIGAINGSLEAALLDYINGGGSVLAAAGPLSGGLSTVPVLGNAIARPAVGPSGRVLSQPITRIDTSHPVLAENSGWAGINVRAIPVTTTAEDQILIAQSARSPVLLQRNIGAGRMMLLTTSLDNSASDLPVKPVFVTFMSEVARYLSNEQLLLKEQTADSYLQLTRTGGASGQVVDPDGISLLSLQDTTRNQDVQVKKTGYYQVFTPAGEILVAVNPDLKESDPTLMPAQALQNWQSAVTASASGSNTNASSVETGDSVANDADEIEFWRILLILLALAVLAESLLSNRYLNFRTGTV